MKRFLFVFGLLFVFCCGASYAQAEPVANWNISYNISFTDVIMRDGSTAATWSNNNSFGWSNSYGESATLSYKGSGSMTTVNSGPNSSDYFSGNILFTATSNMSGAHMSDVKGLTIKYDLVFTPTENSSKSVSASIEMPVYFYSGDLGLNDDGLNDIYGKFNMIVLQNTAAPATFVFDGIVYEFDLWQYGGGGGGPAWLRSSAHADAIVADLGLESASGYIFPWPVNLFDIYIDGYARGPAPAVPVPAAVWLLGSGLAGLGIVKRRMRK